MRGFLLASVLVMEPTAALSRMATVPVQFRQVSGTRPFLPVKLNGVPYLFMLHANADFYAMTNHQNAKIARVSVPASTSAFGIEKTGKVSKLGRAEAHAKLLMVGGHSFRDISLSVFETPQTPPMDGMLGVQWIRASQCLVDFARKVVLLPDTSADTSREDAMLRSRRYIAHVMTWDAAKKRYLVKGTVNGLPVTINVATVANDILDIAFAQTADIKLGGKVGEAGGPTGTLEDQFSTRDAIFITIDGQHTVPSHPLVWNIAGYDRSAQAAQQVTIGADFMIANHAVIDFGTGTLYLPQE